MPRATGNRRSQVADVPKPLWRRHAGFSLLEVLLATAILASSVLLISQGFSLGARAAALGRQYTEAVLLGQSRLAELMLEKDLGVLETEGEFEEGSLPDARWSFSAEDTDTAGLVRLTMTVRWGGDWGERQISLSALRPEFGRLPALPEASIAAGGSR